MYFTTTYLIRKFRAGLQMKIKTFPTAHIAANKLLKQLSIKPFANVHSVLPQKVSNTFAGQKTNSLPKFSGGIV